MPYGWICTHRFVLCKFNCWCTSSRFWANMALHCLAVHVAIHSKTLQTASLSFCWTPTELRFAAGASISSECCCFWFGTWISHTHSTIAINAVHIRIQLMWLDQVKGNGKRTLRAHFCRWLRMTLRATLLFVPLQLWQCFVLHCQQWIVWWKIKGHHHSPDTFYSLGQGKCQIHFTLSRCKC